MQQKLLALSDRGPEANVITRVRGVKEPQSGYLVSSNSATRSRLGENKTKTILIALQAQYSQYKQNKTKKRHLEESSATPKTAWKSWWSSISCGRVSIVCRRSVNSPSCVFTCITKTVGGRGAETGVDLQITPTKDTAVHYDTIYFGR